MLLTARAALFSFLAVVILTGCGLKLGEPPLKLEFRPSLVGAGVILQLENTGNEELIDLDLVIRSPTGEERSFRESSLPGYGRLEVGWKKLGGWEIPVGSEVTARCKGYLLPLRGRLGAEQDPGSAEGDPSGLSR